MGLKGISCSKNSECGTAGIGNDIIRASDFSTRDAVGFVVGAAILAGVGVYANEAWHDAQRKDELVENRNVYGIADGETILDAETAGDSRSFGDYTAVFRGIDQNRRVHSIKSQGDHRF